MPDAIITIQLHQPSANLLAIELLGDTTQIFIFSRSEFIVCILTDVGIFAG